MQIKLTNMTDGARSSKYRALFYVFDGGSGIGHLRRISRVAEAMREHFSCLIVTGHDTSPDWMVPPGCEYVRLPSWDNLIPAKAAYWERSPFLDVTLSEAVSLREAILEGVCRGFQPDVLLVDHLPLGAHEELAQLVRKGKFRKYLVTRGIQNDTEDLHRLVLGGDALDSLMTSYTRVFSAIDTNVFDLASSYGLPQTVVEKIVPVGYVAPPCASANIATVRKARGLGNGSLWAVISAGGGQWGEELIDACLVLSRRYPEVYFDIVIGPRSKMARPESNTTDLDGGRVRLHGVCRELASFHASADLVVTTGGYNSLLEALQGQARILSVPYRLSPGDEPIRHASCLKAHVDIRVETNISAIGSTFDQLINECKAGPARDNRRGIKVDGAAQIARAVLNDMSTDSE